MATLVPYTAPAPNFGEIEIEPFTLIVVEPVKTRSGSSAGGEDASAKSEVEPLSLEKSVFSNRRRTSDGHSYLTTAQIMSRAFEIDWSRCNNPRFRTLIGRQDDGGWEMLAQEMNEIREVLHEYNQVVYSSYSYYCAEEVAHDGYAMGLPAYFDFLNDIRIVEDSEDGKQPFCSANNLESIFLAANMEERGAQDVEQRAINRSNADEALMRFEFMQCLVRIAIAKYVRPKHIADISDALAEFMDKDVIPNLPAAAKHDDNVFRKKRLYTRDVDEVFRRHSDPLQTIFNYYAMPGGHMIKEKSKAKEESEARMSIDEWMTLLTDAGLLYLSETETVRHGALRMAGYVDEAQARLCHAWSISFCSDELRRRDKYTSANYIDFLEALGRLCTFMPLPSKEQLALYNAASAMEFLDDEHDGSVLVDENRSWESEEVSDESLAPTLDVLINLILDRLDKNTKLTTNHEKLKQLRNEREAKQAQFLNKREDSSLNEFSKKNAKGRKKK